MATMLVTTRNQENEVIHKPTKTYLVKSSNLKEIIDHMKGNCTTAGFTINYCVHPEKNLVVEIFKKGRLCQRDIKELVEMGFNEFHYSWAFASEKWENEAGQRMEFKKIDLVKMKDVLPYKSLFGY